MSVRREKKNGREVWIIDIQYTKPSGEVTRVRRTSPVQTRRGAEKFERQLRQSLLDGTYRTQHQLEMPTVVEFAAEYIALEAKFRDKPTSIDTKQQILDGHIIPAMGRRRLDGVDSLVLDRFVANGLKKLSPKTVANHLAVVSKILQRAKRRGLIRELPRMPEIRIEESPERDFLTFEEAAAITAAATSESKALIVLALKLGLRLGELRALRWNDLDLRGKVGRISVRHSVSWEHFGSPKGRRGRPLKLPQTAKEALRAHRRGKGPFVFSRTGEQPFSKDAMYDRLHPACDAAGLARCGFYMLRHTACSHMTMMGVPLTVVQEIMGHKDIKTTMKYAHLSPGVVDRAVELLDLPYGTMTALWNEGADAVLKKAKENPEL